MASNLLAYTVKHPLLDLVLTGGMKSTSTVPLEAGIACDPGKELHLTPSSSSSDLYVFMKAAHDQILEE